MKKIACLLLLAGMVVAANAKTATVRLTVELPLPGIVKDSAVFVTGTFNNWNPGDSCCIMKRLDARHYTIDLPCFDKKKYEYKYTLGKWEGVEKKAGNQEIDNRVFTAANKLKIYDKVEVWNIPATKPQASTDTINRLTQDQIAKMTALKDSMTQHLAPILPTLMTLLQKFNTNLLSASPDRKMQEQYNAEAVAIVSKALATVTNAFFDLTSLLTPEQKEKLLQAIKDPNAPKDIVNLILQNLMPSK
jgi:hypothetical protein